MLSLSNLQPLSKKRNRIGRGGSRGGTSGRGHKGQKSRSGSNKLKTFFEGGQMPLSRRLPRRGFTNAFRVAHRALNLSVLEEQFEANDTVNDKSLREKGLLKGRTNTVKILGHGELTKPLIVELQYISKSATEAIEKVGGKVLKVKESDSGSSTA